MRRVEIEHTRLRSSDGAVGHAELDCHAIHEQVVEGSVADFQSRAFGAGELTESVLQRFGGQRRIEPRQRIAQPLRQHDLSVVLALGPELAGCDLWAMFDQPAEAC